MSINIVSVFFLNNAIKQLGLKEYDRNKFFKISIALAQLCFKWLILGMFPNPVLFHFFCVNLLG